MAFNALNLTLLSHGNGFKHFRYDTLDAHATVDDQGYMSNADDAVRLNVGDIVKVIVWATAIRTGTISDVSEHIVTHVLTNGDVNLSTELVGLGPVSGD